VPRFRDRESAGAELAGRLVRYAGREDVVVLGLPRGGVPVAAAVARRLAASLDVLVVRKLGVPGHPELAMGAIASGGVSYLDDRLVARLGVSPYAVEAVIVTEAAELARRETAYRGDRPPVELEGRTVLLIDDGLATGASIRAAAIAVRRRGAAAVIAAAPVGPAASTARLRDVCDAVVLAETPARFRAVGEHYADFTETSDEAVRAALTAPPPGPPAAGR